MRNLKAGDIVLSAGLGVTGALIRVVDGSPFSHSAIIVEDPYIDEPCIWECTVNTTGWSVCMPVRITIL